MILPNYFKCDFEGIFADFTLHGLSDLTLSGDVVIDFDKFITELGSCIKVHKPLKSRPFHHGLVLILRPNG